MNKIMFGFELKGPKRLSNGTIDITLNTQPKSPEEYAAIFSMANHGFALLKDANFDELDLEVMDGANAPVFGKSPSEKLRSALFVAWSSSDKGYDNFNDYYRKYIEDLRIEILTGAKVIE